MGPGTPRNGPERRTARRTTARRTAPARGPASAAPARARTAVPTSRSAAERAGRRREHLRDVAEADREPCAEIDEIPDHRHAVAQSAAMRVSAAERTVHPVDERVVVAAGGRPCGVGQLRHRLVGDAERGRVHHVASPQFHVKHTAVGEMAEVLEISAEAAHLRREPHASLVDVVLRLPHQLHAGDGGGHDDDDDRQQRASGPPQPYQRREERAGVGEDGRRAHPSPASGTRRARPSRRCSVRGTSATARARRRRRRDTARTAACRRRPILAAGRSRAACRAPRVPTCTAAVGTTPCRRRAAAARSRSSYRRRPRRAPRPSARASSRRS